METISFRLPLLKTSSTTNQKSGTNCPRWTKHEQLLSKRKDKNNEENQFQFRIVVNTKKAAIHERGSFKRHVEKKTPETTPYRLTEQAPLIQKKYLQLRPLKYTDIRERKCPGVALCRGCQKHNDLPWLHKRHDEDVQRTGGGYIYRQSIHTNNLPKKPFTPKIPPLKTKNKSTPIIESKISPSLPVISNITSKVGCVDTNSSDGQNKPTLRTMSLQTDYSMLGNDLKLHSPPFLIDDSLDGFQTPFFSSGRNSAVSSRNLLSSARDNLSSARDNLNSCASTLLSTGNIEKTPCTNSPKLETNTPTFYDSRNVSGNERTSTVQSTSIKSRENDGKDSALANLIQTDFIDESYKTYDVMDRFMNDVIPDTNVDDVMDDGFQENDENIADHYEDEIFDCFSPTVLDDEDLEEVRPSGSIMSSGSLIRESFSQVSQSISEYENDESDRIIETSSFRSIRNDHGEDFLNLASPVNTNLSDRIALWTTEAYENADSDLDDYLNDFDEKENDDIKWSNNFRLPKIDSSSNIVTSCFLEEQSGSNFGSIPPLNGAERREQCSSTRDKDTTSSPSSRYTISSPSSTSLEDSESDSDKSDKSGRSFPNISSSPKSESASDIFRRSIKDMVKFPIIASRLSMGTNSQKNKLRKPKMRKNLPQDTLSRFTGRDKFDDDSITTDSDVESDLHIPMMDFAAQHCIISYQNLTKYEKLFNGYAKITDVTKTSYTENIHENEIDNQSVEEDSFQDVVHEHQQTNASESKKAIYRRNREKIIESRDLERCLKRLGKDFKPLELEFIKRMMQLRGKEEKLSFKTFSIVAALTERITSLDSSIKQYCEELDLRTLERKLDKCKELYLLLLGKNSNSFLDMDNPFFIPLDALNTELEAGNITHSDRQSVIEKLYENENVNFLDFVMYIPLFLVIHERIVNRPIA